jgi:dTDP-4-amino-4,6-dideoxygalactose transaminase
MGTAVLRFVESKSIDWNGVQNLLTASASQNHWANFGPVSLALEESIARLLGLHPDSAVVATSSGTSALFALLGVETMHAGRPLRWLASAFGFASTRIGPLAGSIRLIDCDDDGLIDLDQAANVPAESWDGLLVTNVFGRCVDLDGFAAFCKQRGKSLIIDNAQALLGLDRSSKAGADEFLSLHHTKPWGFGEGGCAIVKREDVDICRRLLNFAYGLPDGLAAFAANGKISELAAAAILSRLNGLAAVAPDYQRQWQRIAGIAERAGYRVFSRVPEGGVLGFVPLQAPVAVSAAALRESPMPMAKYYPPLADRPRARRLYEHMVCVACHPGVAELPEHAIYHALRAVISAGL